MPLSQLLPPGTAGYEAGRRVGMEREAQQVRSLAALAEMVQRQQQLARQEEQMRLQEQGRPLAEALTRSQIIRNLREPEPKTPSDPEIVKLSRLIETLPAGSPMRMALEARVKKLSESSPAVSISMPGYAGVVDVEGEDGGTRKVLVQAPKGGGPPTRTDLGPKPRAPSDVGGLSADAAGKASMASQAIDNIGTVRGKIFDKAGELNHGLLLKLSIPGSVGLPRDSDARIVWSAIHNAIESKLRLETGAAATQAEVQRTAARFLPTVSDTKESAEFKLNELEKYFKGTLAQIKGLKTQSQGIKTIKTDDEYNALPSGTEFIAPDGSKRRKP